MVISKTGGAINVAPGISPEIVAAIMASVYTMMGTRKVAVQIKHTNKAWVAAGRQKIMDARQFV